METNSKFNWKDHISIVDSSLNAEAIANVIKVDTEMLAHMDDLQDKVQADLTKFQPVIVAQFTPGGGKFTLVRNEYGEEARYTVEPVARLFYMAKSIAHAPLGIFGCFGPYSTDPKNQGWRAPMEDYRNVLAKALSTIDDIDVEEGYQIDDTLKKKLVLDLNNVTGEFDDAPPHVDESTVVPHIIKVMKDLLKSSIDFVDNTALKLSDDESPAEVFQKWCNMSSGDNDNPDDTLYKLIVQSQVIAASTQQLGISSLMKTWRDTFSEEDWKNLYVIVQGEWVTRKLNSIAQCILPEMADKEEALDEHLLIVTNLTDVDPALHFLARILEDRSAAAMILTDHSQPRNDLSGQVDLLGPVMQDVVCPHMSASNKAPATSDTCPH
ncbi:hypothetical protein [uncultured Psychroserpens sp.]|uniref:hypothetical protein n=1 Tax=uncultured Psychroserpens sp. TaxID=255436 RepID=UPI0026068FF2|nr:hypothetical protein [uncultured Psychroserpens sp.]